MKTFPTMPISTIDPASSTQESVARAPDGAELRARFDGTRLTVFASNGCWKRAPADCKTIEDGARFMLVDIGGKLRVARVAGSDSGP